MKSNAKIITDFYTAFQNEDAEGMVQWYSDAITFEDPAFGSLSGIAAKNMWRMLCDNSKDLKVTFHVLAETGNTVTAHWEAIYTFSRTGRIVHNKVAATFTLEDGLIIDHRDHFNLWTWSQQALGTAGWLVGWSSSFRQKLQKQTQKLLSEYTSKH